MAVKSRTIDPPALAMEGVRVVPRAVHHDPRGFLIETLRQDDREADGASFAMSYLSMTVPGEKRDVDRWHVHQHQTDRFVVLLGEMILALYDPRPNSATRGHLATIRMLGAGEQWQARPAAGRRDATTYLVTIPPQVYHCIGNLSREPFLLQNYPTRLYDPADEGRIPFVQAPVAALGNTPFHWDAVEVVRP